MKVLLVHNTYQQRGGEDTVFESERTLLRENGHDVEDLCFDNDWISSPLSRVRAGVANLYHRSSARLVEERIAAGRPEVVHVHNFFPTASPAVFWAASRRRVPIVLTLHNYRLLCAKANLYRDGGICTRCVGKRFPLAGIAKGCYRGSRAMSASIVAMSALHRALGTWSRKIDHYIALTRFSRDVMASSALGIPEERMTVKPNFTFDRGIGPVERDGGLLFIGRLTEEKGVRVLLEAAEELSPELVIIGTGPLEEEVRAFAAKHPQVRFLGFQNADVIVRELKRAKALVFPSTWYESFGMTLIEAFSTGTPVIASDHGTAAEIVEEGRTGLKYEVGSAVALRAKARELLADEERRRRMGEAARAAFLEHYTPEANHEQLIRIYERAAVASRRRREGREDLAEA